MKKALIPLLLIGSFCITSCSVKMTEPVSYYANPVLNEKGQPVELYKSQISLTTYNETVLNKISPLFQETVENIHIASDRYNYFNDKNGKRINNLKVVNDSYGTNKPVKINDELYYLLELSLKIHELSEGYFNPTMGSLIDLWDKTIPSIPGYGVEDIVGTEEFNIAFSQMIPYNIEDPMSNYIVLDEANKTVTFKKYKDIEDIDISLGGIAKGYGMYRAEEVLKAKYDYPMMIDGGSSSLALLGDHPHKGHYTIGVASPYSVTGSPLFGQKILYAVKLDGGTNISTSGDYLHYAYITDKKCDPTDKEPCQRLKQDLGDGKFRYIRRHHILNPFTGYSENYYRIINLQSKDHADVLDALSTILFNIDIVNDRDTFLRVVKNFEGLIGQEIDFLLEQEYSYVREDKQEWSSLDIYMSSGMEKTIDRSFKPQVDAINQEFIIEK